LRLLGAVVAFTRDALAGALVVVEALAMSVEGLTICQYTQDIVVKV
jgi:hypothetical protein